MGAIQATREATLGVAPETRRITPPTKTRTNSRLGTTTCAQSRTTPTRSRATAPALRSWYQAKRAVAVTTGRTKKTSRKAIRAAATLGSAWAPGRASSSTASNTPMPAGRWLTTPARQATLNRLAKVRKFTPTDPGSSTQRQSAESDQSRTAIPSCTSATPGDGRAADQRPTVTLGPTRDGSSG